MSTQKWSDDDLDDLFRKSAEESDPTYDPAAWQDLQTRLNNHDRTLLRTKLLRWGLPALLLLLTGSLTWYTQQQSSKASATLTVLPKKAQQTEVTPGAPATSQPTDENVRQGTTTQNDQPVLAGQPVAKDGVATPGDLGTSKQQDQLIADEPTGTTEPNSKHKTIDRTADATTLTERPGSNPVGQSNERKAKQPPLTLRAEPTSAADRPAGTKNRLSNPMPGSPVTNPAGTERLSSNRIGRAGRLKPKPLPDLEVPDALVTGRRSSHLTSTARQDAKIGGLGRQRSVVPGLVTSQGAGGTAQPNSVTANDYQAAPSVGALQQEAPVTTERFIWPPLNALTAKQAKSPLPPALMVEPTAPESSQSAPASPSVRTRLSGLSVQLVFSPDLSSIGLSNFDRPGTNIGVMAQYQLSDRFSVQTGALWSTKLYTTSASEYVWPVPTGMSALPESIAGKCTMLDLPLNVRYDILVRPDRANRGAIRWFVSGGVTSYFIDHEVYKYTYANPYDPSIKYQGYDNKVVGRKGGSFGLSNLNVSIGYERPIGKRLSWQIEPFMKVPLKEVGYFKVKLLSTGAFLSLRYRL